MQRRKSKWSMQSRIRNQMQMQIKQSKNNCQSKAEISKCKDKTHTYTRQLPAKSFWNVPAVVSYARTQYELCLKYMPMNICCLRLLHSPHFPPHVKQPTTQTIILSATPGVNRIFPLLSPDPDVSPNNFRHQKFLVINPL